MLKGSTSFVVKIIFLATFLISICNGQSCEYYVDSDGDDSYICIDYCGTGTAFGYSTVEATGDIICAVICSPNDDADGGVCTSDFINAETSAAYICPKYCGIDPNFGPNYLGCSNRGDGNTICALDVASPLQVPLDLNGEAGVVTFGSESILLVRCDNDFPLSISTCECFIVVNDPGTEYNGDDICFQCTLDSISKTSISLYAWDCSNRLIGNCATFYPSLGCISNEPTPRPTLPPRDPPTPAPRRPPVRLPTIPPVRQPTLPPVRQPTLPPFRPSTSPPVRQPTLIPVRQPTIPPVQPVTFSPDQEAIFKPVRPATFPPRSSPVRSITFPPLLAGIRNPVMSPPSNLPPFLIFAGGTNTTPQANPNTVPIPVPAQTTTAQPVTNPMSPPTLLPNNLSQPTPNPVSVPLPTTTNSPSTAPSIAETLFPTLFPSTSPKKTSNPDSNFSPTGVTQTSPISLPIRTNNPSIQPGGNRNPIVGTLVGGIAGGFALAAVIGTLVFYKWRKNTIPPKGHISQSHFESSTGDDFSSPTHDTPGTSRGGINTPTLETSAHLQQRFAIAEKFNVHDVENLHKAQNVEIYDPDTDLPITNGYSAPTPQTIQQHAKMPRVIALTKPLPNYELNVKDQCRSVVAQDCLPTTSTTPSNAIPIAIAVGTSTTSSGLSSNTCTKDDTKNSS